MISEWWHVLATLFEFRHSFPPGGGPKTTASYLHSAISPLCLLQVHTSIVIYLKVDMQWRLMPMATKHSNFGIGGWRRSLIRMLLVEISWNVSMSRAGAQSVAYHRRHKRHVPSNDVHLFTSLLILWCSVWRVGAWAPHFGLALEHVSGTPSSIEKRRNAYPPGRQMRPENFVQIFHVVFQTPEPLTDGGTRPAHPPTINLRQKEKLECLSMNFPLHSLDLELKSGGLPE